MNDVVSQTGVFIFNRGHLNFSTSVNKTSVNRRTERSTVKNRPFHNTITQDISEIFS